MTVTSTVEAQAPTTYCVIPSVPDTPPAPDPPPSVCEPRKCDKCTGSPCYIASGVYVNDFTDLQIMTASFPIVVGRNYNSARQVDGPIGVGWASTLTPRLYYAAYLASAPNTYLHEIDLLMPDGNVEKFTDLGGGNFNPPLGRFDRLIRNADGTYDLTLQHSRTVDHFNVDGTLATTTDGYGNVLAYTYSNGRLSTVADQAGSGRQVTLTWGGDGRISVITDSTGRTIRYTYASDGTLTTVENPLSQETKMTYVAGRFAPILQTIRDDVDRLITRLTWDSVGRLASYTEGDPDQGGETYSYSYFPNAVPPHTIKTHFFGEKQYDFTPGGALITNNHADYDAEGSLIRKTDWFGNHTDYTYTSGGRPLSVSIDGPDPVTWTLAYDTTFPENVLSMTASRPDLWAGQQYTYYTAGSPAPGALKEIFQVRSDGVTKDLVATYAYDARGRVIMENVIDQGPTSLTYDAHGDLTVVARAGPTTSAYDTLGRVTSITDALGHTTTFAYDVLDRVTSVTPPKPTPSSPLTFQTTYSYDHWDAASGLLFTHVTDPNGRLTQQGYDALGHLVKTVDTLGNVAMYTYAHGLLERITDANGNITRYEYGEERTLQRTVFPDGSEETYGYDWDGRLVTKTDRMGTAFGYTLDAFGRVINEVAMSGNTVLASTTRTFSGQKLTNISYVVPNVHADGIAYTHDTSFRVVTEAQNLRAKITYTYPSLPGSRLIASYTVAPAVGAGYSPRVDYTYDGLGRIIGIQWSPVAGQFTIAYDMSDRYTSITYPSGQSRTFTYDDQGRLTQLANIHPIAGDLATFSYGYDHNWLTNQDTLRGQRTSMNFTGAANTGVGGPPAGLTKYWYDDGDQLIRADYPGNLSETWTYDPIGNRVTRQFAGGPVQGYAYYQNAAGHNSLQLKNLAFSPDYVYDASGNQTGAGTTTYYTWDAHNRMTSTLASGPPNVAYTYDALGRRVSRSAYGATTHYQYVGMNTVGERNSSSQPISNDYLFAPGVDEPLAMSTGPGSITYFGVDGEGSIMFLADAAGNISQGTQYDPWGNGSPLGLFGYTGRETGDGFLYYRARNYVPGLGRFLSEDPLLTTSHYRIARLSSMKASAQPDSSKYGLAINAYAYVGNDPIRFTDPTGRDREGCDFVFSCFETPRVLDCCYQHDQCYHPGGRQRCTWWSWITQWPPVCTLCNMQVVCCVEAIGLLCAPDKDHKAPPDWIRKARENDPPPKWPKLPPDFQYPRIYDSTFGRF